MTMYRKISAEVEARLWDAGKGLEAAQDLALWCGGVFTFDDTAGQEMNTYYWSISVKGGITSLHARPGGYIIKHHTGNFYQMPVTDFEATYEKSTK